MQIVLPEASGRLCTATRCRAGRWLRVLCSSAARQRLRCGLHPQKEEESLDPSRYFEQRVAAMEARQREQGPLPYRFDATLRLKEFRAKYDGWLADGEHVPDTSERVRACASECGRWAADAREQVAGRIMGVRQQGRLIFFELR